MEGYIEQELGIHGPDMGEHLGKEALSVTTLGLALLTFLGCNPIFFVGVDLACQGKEHYAPGFTARLSETRLVRRKGIGGTWVRTQDKWILEAEALGAFIKKHPATRFIDTKKSGLPIPHAHNLPLIHEWNARDLVGYIQGLIQSASLGVSCDALSALKHTIHTSLHAVHTAYSSPPRTPYPL